MRIDGFRNLWVFDYPHFGWFVPPVRLSLCLFLAQVRAVGVEYSLHCGVRPNGLVSESHFPGKCGFLPLVVTLLFVGSLP